MKNFTIKNLKTILPLVGMESTNSVIEISSSGKHIYMMDIDGYMTCLEYDELFELTKKSFVGNMGTMSEALFYTIGEKLYVVDKKMLYSYDPDSDKDGMKFNRTIAEAYDDDADIVLVRGNPHLVWGADSSYSLNLITRFKTVGRGIEDLIDKLISPEHYYQVDLIEELLNTDYVLRYITDDALIFVITTYNERSSVICYLSGAVLRLGVDIQSIVQNKYFMVTKDGDTLDILTIEKGD